MEAKLIQDSLDGMKDALNKRMAAFEDKLHHSSAPEASVAGISAEFVAFRLFVTQTISCLQKQIEMLAHETDQLEMRSRRKILLIHGVAETKDEDTTALATKLVTEKLCVTSFVSTDISRCKRMGRSIGNRTRPILLKFRDLAVRDQAWSSKTRLKGTGVTLSEFLTKRRHDAFIAAREKFGVTQCWTREGFVHILAPDGSRHRVITVAELRKVPSAPAPVVSNAGTSNLPPKPQKTTTTRPVRAAKK